MRIPLVALGVVAIVLLGSLQCVSVVTLRAAASAASLPALAPSWLARYVDSIEPAPLVPEELRRVLGAAAAARGDVPLAERFAQSLRPSPDRLDLEARIANARGDAAAATRLYLAAGDLPSLEAHVDGLVAAGRVTAALELQSLTIDGLIATNAQHDTLAEAYYRSGLLDQTRAYEVGPATRAGAQLQTASRDAYAKAVAFAPLEERYLIALGNQDLNVGDLERARGTFVRVRDLDPTSVEALTGLADAALRANDPQTARTYLDAASRLAPDSPDVARMRARLPT